MTPSLIVTEARTWIGTKWRHQGRTRDGIDCVGLIVVVLMACGWEPKDKSAVMWESYSAEVDRDHVLPTMRAEAPEIEDLADLKIGDVLVFHMPGHVFAQHCGIVSRQLRGELYFIHADADPKNRRVLEEKFSEEWRNVCVAAFRVVTNG